MTTKRTDPPNKVDYTKDIQNEKLSDVAYQNFYNLTIQAIKTLDQQNNYIIVNTSPSKSKDSFLIAQRLDAIGRIRPAYNLETFDTDDDVFFKLLKCVLLYEVSFVDYGGAGSLKSISNGLTEEERDLYKNSIRQMVKSHVISNKIVEGVLQVKKENDAIGQDINAFLSALSVIIRSDFSEKSILEHLTPITTFLNKMATENSYRRGVISLVGIDNIDNPGIEKLIRDLDRAEDIRPFVDELGKLLISWSAPNIIISGKIMNIARAIFKRTGFLREWSKQQPAHSQKHAIKNASTIVAITQSLVEKYSSELTSVLYTVGDIILKKTGISIKDRENKPPIAFAFTVIEAIGNIAHDIDKKFSLYHKKCLTVILERLKKVIMVEYNLSSGDTMLHVFDVVAQCFYSLYVDETYDGPNFLDDCFKSVLDTFDLSIDEEEAPTPLL